MLTHATPAQTTTTPQNGGATALVLCLSEAQRAEWARRLEAGAPAMTGRAELGSIRALVRRVHLDAPRVAVHELDAPLQRSERLIRAVRSMAPAVPLFAVAGRGEASGPPAELAARRAGATAYAMWPEDAAAIFGGCTSEGGPAA